MKINYSYHYEITYYSVFDKLRLTSHVPIAIGIQSLSKYAGKQYKLKHILFILLLLIPSLFSQKVMAQGGNTCADADLAPITLPFSAQNLKTCGSGDDYTAANTISCGDALYKASEDKIFAFTPT